METIISNKIVHTDTNTRRFKLNNNALEIRMLNKEGTLISCTYFFNMDYFKDTIDHQTSSTQTLIRADEENKSSIVRQIYEGTKNLTIKTITSITNRLIKWKK